jgi:hypothetical protein
VTEYLPNNNPYPLMISVVVTSAAQLASVYALLGGAAPAAVAAGNAKASVAAPVTAGASEQSDSGAEAAPSLTSSTATTDASPSDAEIDAHGHPWSADLHASTKGKTKDGLWRMKVGVTRPDPLPGFPVESAAGTGTAPATPTPSATSPAAAGAASAPAATVEEDDEFAAFRNAAAESDAADAAAAASVPARTYSDADLGALCNQAAVKLGDPSPIKEIIAQYVPEGQVAHSRNIPEDKRAEFVAAVEAKAGIEFAG